jgi:hypothetical protein
VKLDSVDSSTPQYIYEEGSITRGLNMYVFQGRLYVGAWDNGFETFLSAPINAGEWSHIGLVLDANSGKLRGYLDGRKFDAGNAGVLERHGGQARIGGESNLGTRFHDSNQTFVNRIYGMTGVLDDLRVYDRALADYEIAALAEKHSLD